jgi:protein tyrosine/serine phosphatase
MKRILVFCLLISGCRWGANFHEVDPGKFYRSAQLTGEEFQLAIDEYEIKTIVNLRGVSALEEWYIDEKKVVENNKILHVNIPMSAGRLPHRKNLVKLLDSLKTAPRPILVHCKAGADRTGEASAMYQMIYMGFSKKRAMKMLSMKYYHVERVTPAKRYFMSLFQGEKWAHEEYAPCDLPYKYYDKEKYCNED